MEKQELLEENKKLRLENAALLEKITQVIKERDFWYGVVSELWDRAQKAMVRRE